LSRIPAWQLADRRLPEPQRVLDQLLVAVGAKPSLDWEDEVEPWLGERAGLAGWLRSPSGPDFSAVAWIDSTDDEAAEEAMRQAVGAQRDGSFEGTELHRGTGKRADVYWGVHDGRVLVGNGKGSITAALRAAGGESLDEGEDWERLRGERGGDALMSVYGTPELAEQLEELASEMDDEAGDDKGEAKDDAAAGTSPSRQLQQVAEQLQGQAREFSFHLGSDDDGLWMEAIAVGEDEAAEAAADAPGARELLEQLPEQTVLGMASRVGGSADADAVEAMREQMEQYEGLMSSANAGGGGMPPLVRDLPELFEMLATPEFAERSSDAYRGDISFGVTVDEGELSVVGSYGVDDEDAALELEGETVQALGEYVAERSDLQVTRVPVEDGASVVVKGIPAQQAIARIAATTGVPPAKVRSNPLAQRFLRPQLTMEQRTVGENEQVFAFPGDAIGLVEGARSGEPSLADGTRYQRDVQAADVPDEVDSMFWVDARELLRPVIEPVQGQAWVLVQNQIDHLGGPIGWSWSERDGSDTVRSSVVEVPLYD
jgi:hypothetical protein